MEGEIIITVYSSDNNNENKYGITGMSIDSLEGINIYSN